MDDIGNEFHFVCICTIHRVEKYISRADPGIFARWGVQARLPCADPGIFVRGPPGQSDKKALTPFFLVLSLFY